MFPACRKARRCRLILADDRQGKHYFPFIAERNSFREYCPKQREQKRLILRISRMVNGAAAIDAFQPLHSGLPEFATRLAV